MTLLELIMIVLPRVLLKLHGFFSHIHVSNDLIEADVTMHDVTSYDVTDVDDDSLVIQVNGVYPNLLHQPLSV